MQDSAHDRAIVTSLIDMSHQLNLKVIAEGVGQRERPPWVDSGHSAEPTVPPLHKSPPLTHMGVAVIGRPARRLVVADKPDAAAKAF